MVWFSRNYVHASGENYMLIFFFELQGYQDNVLLFHRILRINQFCHSSSSGREKYKLFEKFYEEIRTYFEPLSFKK